MAKSQLGKQGKSFNPKFGHENQMDEIALADSLSQLAGLPASEFVFNRESMLLPDRLPDEKPKTANCDWQILDSSEFFVPDFGVAVYVGIEHLHNISRFMRGARQRIPIVSTPWDFTRDTVLQGKY